MKEYYVITNRNGMISLEEKSTPKRDPPSQESRERKKILKQEISKNPKFESFLKENKVYGRFISNFMNEMKNVLQIFLKKELVEYILQNP